MTPAWQLPRYGSLWLLLGFVAAVSPLFSYLPGWLIIVASAAVIWRLLIYRGRVGAPKKLLKVALVILCVAGLLFSFPKPYGLEPMATLLVSAYSLKLLEMKGKRDALITVYLGFFVAIILSLFDQGMFTGLYIVVPVVLLIAGLAGINQSDRHRHHLQPLRTAALMVAQAIPLMLVIFLLLPRLGPLWAVPGLGPSARTGMSDTMSPGDITRLGRSAEIAFRVAFEGEKPVPQQLYWRGLTLSRFKDRQWTHMDGWGYSPGLIQWQEEPDLDWFQDWQRQGRSSHYEITLEPTHEHWLFGLDTPEPASKGVGLMQDFTLVTKEPVNSRRAYRVTSWLDQQKPAIEMSDLRRKIELSIPESSNPQTQAIARQWAVEAGNPKALIQRVLTLFNQRFVYTLSPPPLGRHTVDDFLWQTRTGFCEHFASSFAFFMRAAGIPARVVIGYQGGEWHPDQGYLIVRQYDAHAWTEVWLEEEGWVRVDPTAAVAPERIELGAMDMLQDEDAFFADSPFALARFHSVAWVNSLRMQLDLLEYGWSKWVLAYDDHQQGFLSGLLGNTSYLRMALFMVVAGLVAMIPVFWFSFNRLREPPRHPLDQRYWRFCRVMARHGIHLQTGEAPYDFARRCARVRPADADIIKQFIDAYIGGRFAGKPCEKDRLNQLLKKLHPLGFY